MSWFTRRPEPGTEAPPVAVPAAPHEATTAGPGDAAANAAAPTPPPPDAAAADAGPRSEAEAVFSTLDEAVRTAREFASRQEEMMKVIAAERPAEGPADPRPALDELARKLDALAARQDELHQLYESRIHSDEAQARAVEKLHDQLQAYKANFLRQALLPLLKEVIFCYDFVAGELDRLQAADPPPDPGAPVKALDHLKQMLLDLLYKHDVEPLRPEGDRFDRRSQQCVQTVPTDVEADDQKVAAVGLTGFRSGDTVLRKEHVTVRKYSDRG